MWYLLFCISAEREMLWRKVVTSRCHSSKISGRQQTENVIDQFHLICKIMAKFSGIESLRTVFKFRKRKLKENFCVLFTNSIKRACEIRKFHVAVAQRELRNVQKSMTHVQSCCFANIHVNLLLFCPSSLPTLSSWSRNFATMVMWHHTSPPDYLTWKLHVGHN